MVTNIAYFPRISKLSFGAYVDNKKPSQQGLSMSWKNREGIESCLNFWG